MARYDKPFGRSGANNPAALDVGKKLLGELAEQRRLSPGTPTRQIQTVMDDGTLVIAAFAGEIPRIHVVAGNRSVPTLPSVGLTLLQGLAVQPRTFASPTGLGANPEAILMPRDGEWRNFLYDSSYLDGLAATATGYYQKTLQGKDLFPGGLPSSDRTGWVDWRNQDESIALCWKTSISRYFPNGSHAQYGNQGKIFYNAGLLLDVWSDLPEALGNRYLLGCALSGDTLLVAIGDQPDFGELADWFIQFYAVKVEADTDTYPWFASLQSQNVPFTFCPRLKIQAGTATKVHELPYPSLNGYPPPRFAFNQSANECRTILHEFWFYDGEGNDKLRVHEIVVDFRDYLADPDNNEVTSTDDIIHSLQNQEWDYYTYDVVRINAVNGLYTAPTGPTEYMYEKPFYANVLGGLAGVLPLEGSYDFGEDFYLDDGDPCDWYKLGVDYQDDVPVYCWAQPEITRGTTSYAGSATANADRPDNLVEPEHLVAAASMSSSEDRTGSRGFGLKCVDKNGDTWLEVTCARSRTRVLTAESDEDATLNDSAGGDLVGTMNTSLIEDRDELDELLAVYFLDLRYRSAAYSKIARTYTRDLTQTTTDTLTAPSFTDSFTADFTIESTDHTEFAIDTRVIFFGDEVDAFDGSYTPADIVVSSSGTATGGYRYTRLDAWGWAALGATGYGVLPLFDDTYFLAKGGDGTPPFPDWNTPETDYPPSSQDIYSSPLGAYDWEFYASQIENAAGTWPRLKNLPSQATVMVGAFGTFKDGNWVYSMADLSDDVRDEKWVQHISGTIDNFDDGVYQLTGKNDAMESVGQIWPLSTFVHGFQLN